MKFIILGDCHLSDKQIMTRVDSSAETALRKLSWVVDYALVNNAVILHTGDFTTGQLLTNRYRIAVRDILKKLKTTRGANAFFCSISGNHDASGEVYSTIWEREYGLFVMDGYINHLDTKPVYGGSFAIGGISAYHDLDEVLNSSETYQHVEVLLVHAFIQDAFGDTLVVYPDDLKKKFPDLKYLIAGHDHQKLQNIYFQGWGYGDSAWFYDADGFWEEF